MNHTRMTPARSMMAIAACAALASGCSDEPRETPEVQEIIDNLLQAGFPAGDIAVVDGVVLRRRLGDVRHHLAVTPGRRGAA